ncbi:MAG: LemA family protein [Elusimicrobia bacterium]|nr:LemA family protein [Candidatus Obscuribacterium magneticum]
MAKNSSGSGSSGKFKWVKFRVRPRTCVRIALALLFLVNGVIIYYSMKFVRLQQEIFAQGSRVEVEHQRRSNLVPRLAEITRAYAQHERDLMQYVSDARALMQSSQKLKSVLGASKGAEIERTFSKLIALAEQYPDLKAERSYQSLMEKIVATENRVAAARQKLVVHINDYNLAVLTFPGTVFAPPLKFGRMEVYRPEKDPVPARDKRFFYIY